MTGAAVVIVGTALVTGFSPRISFASRSITSNEVPTMDASYLPITPFLALSSH